MYVSRRFATVRNVWRDARDARKCEWSEVKSVRQWGYVRGSIHFVDFVFIFVSEQINRENLLWTENPIFRWLLGDSKSHRVSLPQKVLTKSVISVLLLIFKKVVSIAIKHNEPKRKGKIYRRIQFSFLWRGHQQIWESCKDRPGHFRVSRNVEMTQFTF